MASHVAVFRAVFRAVVLQRPASASSAAGCERKYFRDLLPHRRDDLFTGFGLRSSPRSKLHGLYGGPGMGVLRSLQVQQVRSDQRQLTNLNSPYPQGDIELYDFEKWTASELRIKSIDTTNNIIYLTGPTYQQDYYHGFIAGHRYVVENIKDELTQPGQCFLDRSRTPWTLTY